MMMKHNIQTEPGLAVELRGALRNFTEPDDLKRETKYVPSFFITSGSAYCPGPGMLLPAKLWEGITEFLESGGARRIEQSSRRVPVLRVDKVAAGVDG